MSTNINAHDLKNFIQKNLHVRELSREQAVKYDIKVDKFSEADIDENDELNIDEILEDKDLYAKFAALYVEEQDKKTEAKNKEEEKRKQEKVQDKSQAKA